MRVQDILRSKSPNIITIPATASITQASRVISGQRIGVLIVVDQQQAPVGLLSERDIVCFVAEKGVEALQPTDSSFVSLCVVTHVVATYCAEPLREMLKKRKFMLDRLALL